MATHGQSFCRAASFRFSLYCDDIVLVNPFIGPLRSPGEDNPLVSPFAHRQDMLRMIFSMVMLDPWIRSGIVHLIPSPAAFDPKLEAKTIAMAKARSESLEFTDEERDEVTAPMKEERMRAMRRLPERQRIAMIRRYDPTLSDDKVKDIVALMDQEVRDDPFNLLEPLRHDETQIHSVSQGVNLETALYVCQLTGGFPYSSLRAVWRQLDGMKEGGSVTPDDGWSALTRAFGGLRFQFLNDVDSEFAHGLRQGERLSGFRTFLRKIWKGVNDDRALSAPERLTSEFQRELKDEYKRAEDEWKSIDTDLHKFAARVTPPTIGAIVGAAISGLPTLAAGLLPCFAAAGYTWAGIVELVSAKRKRDAFRNKVPMSVMLDLAKFAPGKRI